ncbi:type II toxin-antitoxin system Phd/YefM family antitoxin [Candidatus Leptofilum sp.]|uniref:type II toxin-antitoxin system Phd/YefM family antitoxin n=1 Tax=Candidatus Leptofilum sp. TaxID=3241576 RepID=UPI003B59DD6A
MERTISKSKLKANMLRIFREIEASNEELTVTDHGVPVLKIVPIKNKKSIDELFAPYRGKMSYTEDLNTPTIDEWEDI